MQITARVFESTSDIANKILQSILQDIKSYMSKVSRKLQPEIRKIVKQGFISSPEYRSLLSGDLKYQFGIANSYSSVEQILNVWDNLEVKFDPPKIKGNQIIGGLQISMINSNYNDVLRLSGSVVETKKGQKLPWLEWLLLLGDKTIIRDYEIFIGANPDSRTGGAVMKKVVGGKWKVPSQFSGNPNNNWVTRVLDSVSDEIDKAIKKAVKL